MANQENFDIKDLSRLEQRLNSLTKSEQKFEEFVAVMEETERKREREREMRGERKMEKKER